MTVDLFSPVIDEHQQHLIFRRLCGSRQAAEREVLRDWSRGFVDRDGKFVKEFQATFESSMWELYVHACIRELGGGVDFKHARPDFVASLRGVDLCVEATVAQPPAGGPPAFGEGPPEIPVDLNEFNRDSIVRISSRFTAKSDLYLHRYSTLAHVKDKPFVIALAPFDRPAAQLAHNRPIIAALFGLYFDEEQSMATRSSRVIRYPLSTVPKSNSVDLPVGFFCDDRYAHVSAVIYSPIAGMGKIRALAEDPVDQLVFKTVHPNPDSIVPRLRTTPKSDYTEHLLDGLYVIHNPNARHPLGFDTLAHERIAQLTLSEGGELLETGPDDFLQVRFVFSLATQ